MHICVSVCVYTVLVSVYVYAYELYALVIILLTFAAAFGVKLRYSSLRNLLRKRESVRELRSALAENTFYIVDI